LTDIKFCSFITQMFSMKINVTKTMDWFFCTLIKFIIEQREHGKEIGCRKNAATFRALSNKRFRSALATTFRACAVAKFEVDDDERDHASEFATKKTFSNALITYLTFQPSQTPEIRTVKSWKSVLFVDDNWPAIEPSLKIKRNRQLSG